MSYYKHSHFEPNAFLNGGNKRTAQINELLIKTDINFIEADFSQYLPSSKNILLLLKGLVSNKKPFSTIRNNYAIERYLKQFEDFIKHKRPAFFIWESTSGYNLLLGKLLNDYNIPFFTLPHNIESLVPGSKSPFTNLNSPKWLLEEISYLNSSNRVFTISQEEQWLLSLNEISVDYLPYHPTELFKKNLLKIRKRKNDIDFNNKQNVNILLLGTFYNKPTLDGYVELIESLKDYTNLTLNICGFGSEQLKDKYLQSNIKIRGTLSIEELNEVIVACDFGIVHQRPSSGALTRIPELLIAGLPLFVNTYAARSSPSNIGLSIYDTIPELLDLITDYEKVIPTDLERPKEEISFINHVKNIISL